MLFSRSMLFTVKSKILLLAPAFYLLIMTIVLTVNYIIFIGIVFFKIMNELNFY